MSHSATLPNVCDLHILHAAMQSRSTRAGTGQGGNRLHALPSTDSADKPTVGAIKRALHDLSCADAVLAQRDHGAMLREAYDQLRQLARSNDIDPDAAIRGRLAAVALLRERMALAGVAESDRTSG